MKVGIDGVLLGAWAHHATLTPTTILDIGTGTGLLALMLAQRFPLAWIDAVEMDEAAAKQALDNVQASPFADRVQVFDQSIQAFQANQKGRYDLIVSNPPYFSNSLTAPEQSRSLARHTVALSHGELLGHAAALLTPHGQFCLLLPWELSLSFVEKAEQEGWSVQQRCAVHPRPNRPPNRCLLQLTRSTHGAETQDQQLCIYAAEKGKAWSEAFKQLTRNFYLSLADRGGGKWSG